jgi:putative two-component system response regulator
MCPDNLSAGYTDADQLKKYADDLAKVYKSEKKKQKEIEAANQQLLKYADDLSKTIINLKAVNQELHEAYIDTINRLVIATEYKDENTGGHIVRIGGYSALIAKKLGMRGEEIQNILYAAPMHDVGKVGVPDSVLLKSGKLTDEEFDLMKMHTTIGAKILANSKSVTLQVAEQIALFHHEKWNGKGYPQGLSGHNIPQAARIVSLADVFDVLVSKRPYKSPYPIKVILEIIRKERGRHFDPDVVDVFLENIDEILKIKSEAGFAEDIAETDFIWSERDLEDGWL